MKLSFLVGAAAGYVLGTRAGRDRYESIVALARKLQGSQTIQSTAGVLRGQFELAKREAKHAATAKFMGGYEDTPYEDRP